jgi:hypothetical protein
MADALFDKGREGFLDGSIDWDTDSLRVIALSSGYTWDAADQFVSDLTPGSNEVTRSTANMTTPTVTSGVADADDHTFYAVAGGSNIYSLVVFSWNTTDADSRVIAFIDGATGLPIATNGGDITVSWDAGANKIFKL